MKLISLVLSVVMCVVCIFSIPVTAAAETGTETNVNTAQTENSYYDEIYHSDPDDPLFPVFQPVVVDEGSTYAKIALVLVSGEFQFIDLTISCSADDLTLSKMLPGEYLINNKFPSQDYIFSANVANGRVSMANPDWMFEKGSYLYCIIDKSVDRPITQSDINFSVDLSLYQLKDLITYDNVPSLTLEQLPAVREYYNEQEYDYSGLLIKAEYADGRVEYINKDSDGLYLNCKRQDNESYQKVTDTVTAAYNGKALTFTMDNLGYRKSLVPNPYAATSADTVVNERSHIILGLGMDYHESVESLFKYVYIDPLPSFAFVPNKIGKYGTGAKIELYDPAGDSMVNKYDVVVKGDITGDGAIDGMDAVLAMCCLYSNLRLSVYQLTAADMDGDSSITPDDINAMILRGVYLY